MTALEKEMHEKADAKFLEEHKYNIKKEKENEEAKGFFGKLWPYTNPRKHTWFAFLISIL